ncbi:hypothetical protein CDD83_8666 [Cordyceps sp. RAO-2017]|nr:hypothetical protein CDD83_8666 [Cordyceps sp. RAO-2017]
MILDGDIDESDPTQTSLENLVSIYPELAGTVKTTVYNWMSSLPRVMQMSDEDAKRIAVQNLAKSVDLLRDLGLESATLDDSMAAALKDSTLTLMMSSPQQVDTGGPLQLGDGAMPLATPATSQQQFQPVILARESQNRLRTELIGLIDSLGSASQKAKLAAALMESVRESASADQTAAMWLCFELVKAADRSSQAADALLDLSAFAESPGDEDAVFSDLYAFAVQVLDSHADLGLQDWRLEALSLEVVAYAAHKLGSAFRPEFIDVLFPVATFLGSENHVLQHHALAALNSVASSARYPSVSDMVIDNVDYMVNSVALRLNTLDVSPASMQVLLMMIRLAGPRLMPFLDDVIDSIFAALDNYHGYTSFVESLFSVLKEIVDQASRAGDRLLTDRERAPVNHRKQRPKTEDLLRYLDERARAEQAARDAAEDASGEIIERHPKEPWKRENAVEEEDDGEQEESDAPPSDEKPPNSPTYQLLLRIAYLTQYYLTSPTPQLRKSLLELLAEASKTLAGDEDSFLPLVNAVWPVVISRLYDLEAFVAIEACNALSSLCEAAGDFMSSRFKTEWADGLYEWCRKAKQRASAGSRGRELSSLGDASGDGDIMIPIRSADGLEGKRVRVGARQQQSGGSLGQHSSPARMWDAAVKLLTAIVSYVHVEDAMFDQILDLLSDTLEHNGEVREALETINAEAVWLVRCEKGYIEPLPTPGGDEQGFVKMERMPRK